MTRTSEVFGGNSFLKAEDLNGKPITVTINKYEVVTLGDKPKVVLSFVGARKSLVINRTNANAIEYDCGYGDEMDNWVGRKITLYPTMVDFQGKRVPAIRIRPPESGNGAMLSKTQNTIEQIVAKQEAAKRSLDPLEALDDEIPF